MSKFGAELTEIRRYADALLIGKVASEEGIIEGKLENESEGDPQDGDPSREVLAQSRVNGEGISEYLLLMSDGAWLDGRGTKRLIFNSALEILQTDEGPRLMDIGYHFPVKEEGMHAFLGSIVDQLHVDIPELAPTNSQQSN